MGTVTALDNELSLLRRAQAGDRDAFARLVRRYEPQLRAAARRQLREPSRTEDVVQEVLLRAYRGIQRFRGESSVRTWLHRITVNACVDERRRLRPVESLDDGERPELPAHEPDPFERASMRHDVAAALATLSPDMRAVVVLVDVEGLDYDTVSRRLGIPVGTVGSRLHRAHHILRQSLQPSAA